MTSAKSSWCAFSQGTSSAPAFSGWSNAMPFAMGPCRNRILVQMPAPARWPIRLRNHAGQLIPIGPMQVLQRRQGDGIGAEKCNAHGSRENGLRDGNYGDLADRPVFRGNLLQPRFNHRAEFIAKDAVLVGLGQAVKQAPIFHKGWLKRQAQPFPMAQAIPTRS